MATETFTAFDPNGNAVLIKGRILRVLPDTVTESIKSTIRSTLSVPASAEGLTPANNLSDLGNAATARTNLGVNSIDEDAEAAGTKLLRPALYFDGTNDYVEIADDAKLSFTDGTDDLPFSITATINPTDLTSSTLIAKYGTTAGAREWWVRFDSGDLVIFEVRDTSGNYEGVYANAALTSYEGQSVNLAFTYGGSGPNSDSAFTAAADEMAIYINGQAVATTENSSGTYTGMSDTSEPVAIGRRNAADYFHGHISNLKIYNRELSAAEVANVARVGQLGFADEWAGAVGGQYTQDSTPSGEWIATNGTDSDTAGPLAGKSNFLTFTADATSNQHYLRLSTAFTTGKRYRIDGLFYIPSGQSNIDGIRFGVDGGTYPAIESSPALDAWNKISFEYVAPGSSLYVGALDGGASTFQDAGGDDVFHVAEIKITEIGTLAELRAEDFNESAGKLLDRSSNNFVGTNNGATLVGHRRHISADTIDLKNLPTSSAGLSAGEVWSNSGVLTIV